MANAIVQRIVGALGEPVGNIQEVHGGCIARVVGGVGQSGRAFVAKVGDGRSDLAIEAAMLRDLARLTSLPVPSVWYADADLLIMSRLAGSPGASKEAQRHLAELLADVHGVEGPSFGYDRDTLIGPLAQPNTPDGLWSRFFARQRVLHFAELAEERGALPPGGLQTARALARALEERPHCFTAPGERPVLIHGDLWSGNILSEGDRITGVIDPAIYYADREIELAFMGLFGCVGRCFFERYHALRPIAPGFFEHRQDMYRVYPLLVHATLFGGGYGRQAVSAMERALAGVPRRA